MSIPEGSSLDNQGVDRQTYEPSRCDTTGPHAQHFYKPMKGLSINCPGVAPGNPGAGDYWNKHNKDVHPDPDKGKPYRHTRQRIRLLIPDLTYNQREAVLWELMEKHPDEVLDAVLKVRGEE